MVRHRVETVTAVGHHQIVTSVRNGSTLSGQRHNIAVAVIGIGRTVTRSWTASKEPFSAGNTTEAVIRVAVTLTQTAGERPHGGRDAAVELRSGRRAASGRVRVVELLTENTARHARLP